MDFDDLIMLTVMLLQNYKEVEKSTKAFAYIMVDEYQDTNHQYELVHLLAAATAMLCGGG